MNGLRSVANVVHEMFDEDAGDQEAHEKLVRARDVEVLRWAAERTPDRRVFLNDLANELERGDHA